MAERSASVVIYCTDCGDRVEAVRVPCPETCQSESREGHTELRVEHACRPAMTGGD